MQTVKVTTSGQISLPKEYRQKFDTNIYKYEQKGNMIIIEPFFEELQFYQTPKKYTKEDLKKAVFISNDKKETNLAGRIDEILYNY